MTTAHKRHSKTFATVASSIGALFIRVFFIATFVYAWLLIAQSSDNNAVHFGDDRLPSEKREHENHLEDEKLIPFENTENLLHPIGLRPAAHVPTYTPFHEDKFVHDPPHEGPVATRHTGFDDTSVPSAVNERQQYDVVTYKNNIKPILKQSFSENNAINFQVPIENGPLNNYEDLLNTQPNTGTSSDIDFREEDIDFTTVSGNNATESDSTPVTPVSVFSNFRDKLLNIISPKASDSENITIDSKAVDLDAERQELYSESRENASLDRASSPVTKSIVHTNGTMSTQPWKENYNQSNNEERVRFQTHSVSNEDGGYILPQRDDEMKLSAKTVIFNKLFHGNNLKENIQRQLNNEGNINTQANRLKESIQSDSDDYFSIQSLQNQALRQNVKLQPHITKEYHTDRQSSGNGMCPAGNVITVVGGGRLANFIWEYASLWSVNKFLPGNRTAYAKKYIMKYLTNVFDNLSMPVVEEIPEDCSCCKNINWTDSNFHANSFVPLKEVRRRFVNVSGHIILSTYILLVEPVLATIISLKKEMVYKQSLVQSAQNDIKSKTDEFLRENNVRGMKITYVGMHVRRTDYKYYLTSKYNMTALGPEFYLKAMQYFREQRPDLGRPIFLVASDDIPWVKKNILQNDVFIVSRGGIEHPEHDLVLLSLCNHSIIDYGTFGLWAAVYAGGVTVSVKTNVDVYRILASKPNWHFVSVNPAEEIQVY